MGEFRRVAVVALVAAVAMAACGRDAATTGTQPDATTPAASTATGGPDLGPDDEPTSGDADTATGPRVPDIEVESFDGATVALSDGSGTPMVINFWASWCGPCVAEMPDLQAVSQVAGDQVRFVGVNTQDDPDDAARLVDETGVTYELVSDPDAVLFDAFGVRGMPSTFYVAADGTIIDRHTGLLTREALRADLATHLGIAVPATPPPAN